MADTSLDRPRLSPEAILLTMMAALCACLTRLEDLGDGDGPTAELARNALREAGL
jgi:hypothetical protein